MQLRDVAHLETLTSSAWPALANEYLDGWVLRFAAGYTKRANSVTPMWQGDLPMLQKVAYCEQRYQQQGLPALFKLSPAAQALDDVLLERGYDLIDYCSVQSRSLQAGDFALDVAVQSSDKVSADWFSRFAELNHVPESHQATAWQMLSSYACPTQFATLFHDGKAVACALAVLQFNTVLLYDVVTLAEQRRQGYARRLVSHLLAWSQQQGATKAVLQVVAANHAACALYAQLGFTEEYPYWYRRQSDGAI
ncbi:GNAT family N-acetyltransferase [Chitinibacter fontanus]|uniref:GNAT family N-acetyltransferase n=1 Tax=Chitinibacter fontanus TaxID=1737446 RepID=A0A7D5ZK89_9NEIS|nr:GNAT family N-acetyltransferase [Chitinibacter fontanus]QLI81850.1 GNAT family N-acetyltransferase [Chitinibacter fontanus]